MASHTPQPLTIFCASAPEDERFYQELATHLRVLGERGHCHLKHAGDIAVGSDFVATLIQQVDQADLVLLLLSSDFFCSVCRTDTTVQQRLESKARQKCLIPLLLRPCLWRDSRFGAFVLLPRNASPISLSTLERDASVQEDRSGAGFFSCSVRSWTGRSTRWPFLEKGYNVKEMTHGDTTTT